ncbi:MAG: phospholipase D-like domain-containing protein [Bradymonadaceae bacterium]
MRRMCPLKTLVTAILALTLAACGSAASGGGPGSSPDGKNADAIPAGKADAPWSECQTEQVMLWLNDPSTELADLKESGVHTRGAGNLIEYRNGEDGEYPSKDDNPFNTLKEVDDVYYVGPTALDQLTSAVADYCERAPRRSADVIFSPKRYDNSHLVHTVELIDQAEQSIDVAMYSFGDQKVLDALERAVNRGVKVRMIYNKTEEERDEGDNTMSAKLEKKGINVRYVNRVMHHKFVIIDGPRKNLRQASSTTLVTGSGNWSYGAATQYDENTVTLKGDAEAALRFQDEFNLMWEYSREYVKNEELSYNKTLEIKRSMIPDRTGIDASYTSDNFKKYINSRWGPTFGIKRGVSTVSKRIVKLIKEADESIWIASGHLRSRPISEALIEKYKNNPDMDIRVYLDGQEYVSEWAHNKQKDELESCLEEAGDSKAQRADCLNKGFYFSYKVEQAGIPLRFKYYAYRWHYSYAKQMHHKYLIFDGETVVSGSYNLSDNAEHNTLENIVVYRKSGYPQLVEAFKSNFTDIWDTGRNEGRYDQLTTEIKEASSEIPIVFEPMALTFDQVDKLKDLIRETCPDVNKKDYRRNPEDHKTCEL